LITALTAQSDTSNFPR